MSISASMVKELREKTNAGMMDCKRALEESKGDFEAAIEWLRIKGLSAASKKADRVAAEGLVVAGTKGNVAAVVEVNSETDFVSRNDGFKKFTSDVLNHVLDTTSTDNLLDQKYQNSDRTLGEVLKEAIATIGENLVIRRSEKYTASANSLVHTYIHGEGRIGVLIEVEGPSAAVVATAEAKTFANDVCLHIAAMNPMALSQADMNPDVIAKEKEILKQKNIESGKKPEMVDKIVEGQIKKFLAENCLVEQAFVKNPDLTIQAYGKELGKKAGGDLAVKRFVRFELGAGIEKKVVDFATEVAEQAKLQH